MTYQQTMEVLVDTGSVNLIVPSVNCTSCFINRPNASRIDLNKATKTHFIDCEDEHCQGVCAADWADQRPDHACSSHGGLCRTNDLYGQSNVCVFRDNYGLNASAHGPLVRGPVSLAGVTVPDAVWGLVTGASDNFGRRGVMGLGLGRGCTYDRTCFPSFFDSLVAKGVSNIFSVCGNHLQPVMIIGGTDARFYQEKHCVYCDMVPPLDFFTINIEFLHVSSPQESF